MGPKTHSLFFMRNFLNLESPKFKIVPFEPSKFFKYLFLIRKLVGALGPNFTKTARLNEARRDI